MKLTRRKIRKLIKESLDNFSSPVNKLAKNFVDGRNSISYTNHVFQLAVSLGHAKEGTLRITEGYYADDRDRERPVPRTVHFKVSSELSHAIKDKFSSAGIVFLDWNADKDGMVQIIAVYNSPPDLQYLDRLTY